LGRLRGLGGFALLVDTLGMFPDANAARVALGVLGRYLGLEVDVSGVDGAAERTRRVLESFGLVRNVVEEKKKEEDQLRWFI
jgi:proteasome assembly chaperone (PAC2) family protein